MDFSDGVCRYTMCFYEKNSSDKIIESCVWFYSDAMELRTYYSQNVSYLCRENIDNIPELMKLINYINACVWMDLTDGTNDRKYNSCCLFTPRLYITEDGFYDITLTTMIPYVFYEVMPVQTENFITGYCPELLDWLNPAVLGIITGQMNLEEAKEYIEKLY